MHNSAFPAAKDHAEAETVVDVTRLFCPMTFVRVRLALDRAAPGAVLRVLLRGDEARANVPRSAAALGHAVLSATEAEDGVVTVLVRKSAA